MVKIGINGFGRLGRLLLRVSIEKSKQKCSQDIPKIVMVNDHRLNSDCTAYLFNNDSIHGKSNLDIVEMGQALMIEGQRVEFTQEPKIDQIPWKNCNVEYIIDTTGQNISCEKASMFLTEGIKRIIVTGCSKVPMFVVGVNHCCFDLQMTVVSAATSSMNCLLPVLKVIHENFEILEATSTVLQPLTNDDKILDDNSSGNCRNSRSSVYSFAPTESTAKGQFVDKIMPDLEGKVQSTAIKIPLPCVGAVDITAKLCKEAPYQAIKGRLKEASETYMKGTLGYTDDYLISSDIIGNPNSAVIDGKASMSVSKCLCKIFAWYDSEIGLANRLYDLASYLSSREGCSK